MPLRCSLGARCVYFATRGFSSRLGPRTERPWALTASSWLATRVCPRFVLNNYLLQLQVIVLFCFAGDSQHFHGVSLVAAGCFSVKIQSGNVFRFCDQLTPLEVDIFSLPSLLSKRRAFRIVCALLRLCIVRASFGLRVVRMLSRLHFAKGDFCFYLENCDHGRELGG